MKGLLQHPTIMLELLRCITPLDYMMLRRATPIFMRNPKVYPSVEDMGFNGVLFSNCTGVPVLLVLHGDDHSVMDETVYYESISISGIEYNMLQNRLRIRDLEAVRLRTFTVDLSVFAKKYLNMFTVNVVLIIDQMMAQINEYYTFGFTVIINHNPEGTYNCVSGSFRESDPRYHEQERLKWNIANSWNTVVAMYLEWKK